MAHFSHVSQCCRLRRRGHNTNSILALLLLPGQAMEFKGLLQFERDFASFFVGLLAVMAALSLLQFGNPGMPSFLGDFFGAGFFMFDLMGLLWSFILVR